MKNIINFWGFNPWLTVDKLIVSYCAENPSVLDQFRSGKISLQIIPQGSLAEKLRAGGSGIAAFYTRTGIGTFVEKVLNKQRRCYNIYYQTNKEIETIYPKYIIQNNKIWIQKG